MADKLEQAQEQFILEWGRMSSSWGINRTMAHIHALLMITGEAFSVDEIIARLHISRGNASMNLRDLVDWGLLRRFRKPGDRRDLYEADGDIYRMFSRVVKERKRREIDPTVHAIKDCIETAPKGDDAAEMRRRLQDLLKIFTVADALFSQVFASEESFREAVSLFPGEGDSSADKSQD